MKTSKTFIVFAYFPSAFWAIGSSKRARRSIYSGFESNSNSVPSSRNFCRASVCEGKSFHCTTDSDDSLERSPDFLSEDESLFVDSPIGLTIIEAVQPIV